MVKNIAVIRGDGIGPEIVGQALKVLDRVAELYGHTFHYTDVDMGGCAIDPDVELSDMLVDNCAMQIVKNPAQFDVVVTENMFGDILSDEASMITGSIGMIPSSSLGATACGLYEPIHGSAPDIAGQDKANPIGTILSAAMMLRFSFDMAKEADAIEQVVSAYLDAGFRTADIMSEGMTLVGCRQCGELIVRNLGKE